MKHIKGPDFPTGGELVSPRADIKRSIRRGGTLASARVVQASRTVTSSSIQLPYQVSGSKVQEQIATADAQQEAAAGEDNIRDESDHEEPTRLVIDEEVRGVDVDELMSHLFSTTSLERTVRVNMNIIGLTGGQNCSTWSACFQGVDQAFRKETVKRRLAHRLQIVLDRLHILDGLARRLPEYRRGHQDHSHRGRAEARADEEVQAFGHPGRSDPEPAPAQSREARGDEDQGRAGRAERRARDRSRRR